MTLSASLRETIKYPTSLIIRGAEPLGLELARALLDQGGFVIVADSEDRENTKAISELKKYKLFRFIDLSRTHELQEALRRLDYVFYFSHAVESLGIEISSHDFLEFSKFLDSVLFLAEKFEAKFLTTTSIRAHQFQLANKSLDNNFDLEVETHSIYIASEIQRYAESLTQEYIKKKSLNARVVRLGEVMGEGIEFSPGTTMGRLIQESITQDKLTIYGDGLEAQYYVHLQDAVYGLIKSQFSKNTRGEIFSLSYEYEISTLSVAYKLNDYSAEAKRN